MPYDLEERMFIEINKYKENSQKPKSKFQILMSHDKPYDLEERTFNYAKDVRLYIEMLTKNPVIWEDLKQLTRASGSVGANYIEAKENLGERDKLMKLKICRKEAKESNYWLKLINFNHAEKEIVDINKDLQDEAIELVNIFSSMINKSNR